MAEWTLFFKMIGEQGADSGDGQTFVFRGYTGQASPTPVVYVDGVEQTSGYIFNAGDSMTPVSVVFGSPKTGQSIRMDYTWKKELDAESELSGYEIEETYNVKDGVDVNGRNFIVESYSKVSSFCALLVWRFITTTLQELLRFVSSQAGSKIRIQRASLPVPYNDLDNLYITKGPSFVEIAGVPNRCHAEMRVVQIQ